ncbi:MAG: protein-glutamate O-methyltransferase CheR [Firmicutes bacterium]|nr:protein-glutamate O-methyltransferase CheR [Bacillota bacterium]
MNTDAWDYDHFKKAFFARTGLNLDCYKDKQMERRIKQIMQREKKPCFKSFFTHLSSQAQMMDRFRQYLTINTSEFFRDSKIFKCLEEDVLPQLLKNYPRGLKVWSAGCSMGAEPLSIAILLHRLHALRRAEIIATDIDGEVLKEAQKGLFNQQYLSKVPEGLRQRYFEAEGPHYRVREALRKAVIYRKHNLLTDRPIPGRHLILCRNVFIYFKAETQQFLLEGFSNNLQPGGFLVIGAAEYISDPGRYSLQRYQNTIFRKQ